MCWAIFWLWAVARQLKLWEVTNRYNRKTAYLCIGIWAQFLNDQISPWPLNVPLFWKTPHYSFSRALTFLRLFFCSFHPGLLYSSLSPTLSSTLKPHLRNHQAWPSVLTDHFTSTCSHCTNSVQTVFRQQLKVRTHNHVWTICML